MLSTSEYVFRTRKERHSTPVFFYIVKWIEFLSAAHIDISRLCAQTVCMIVIMNRWRGKLFCYLNSILCGTDDNPMFIQYVTRYNLSKIYSSIKKKEKSNRGFDLNWPFTPCSNVTMIIMHSSEWSAINDDEEISWQWLQHLKCNKVARVLSIFDLNQIKILKWKKKKKKIKKLSYWTWACGEMFVSIFIGKSSANSYHKWLSALPMATNNRLKCRHSRFWNASERGQWRNEKRHFKTYIEIIFYYVELLRTHGDKYEFSFSNRGIYKCYVKWMLNSTSVFFLLCRHSDNAKANKYVVYWNIGGILFNDYYLFFFAAARWPLNCIDKTISIGFSALIHRSDILHLYILLSDHIKISKPQANISHPIFCFLSFYFTLSLSHSQS